MKYRILIAIYLFYLAYRLIYWGLDDLINVLANATFDTFSSFLTASIIFRAVKNDKKRNNKVIIYLLSVIYFVLGGLLLWTLHLIVYELTGCMTEKFSRTFFSFTFQFFDVFTLLSIGVAVSYAWLKNIEVQVQTKKYLKLMEENRVAELKFLKSQINPHFIFNTLNAINFSIHKNNKKARSLVSDFADLFRFQLYESDQEYILLEKEIDFLRKYINIYEVRMSETYQINLSIEGETGGKQIPPLLTIPLVENSFKHSSNHFKEKSIIDIVIRINASEMVFRIKNSRKKGIVKGKPAEGVGLANVRKRLAILFPDEHELRVTEEDDKFEVLMRVPVKEEA